LPNQAAGLLAMDPQDPQMLYVGQSGGGVYKSLDGGISWSPSNVGIEQLSIRALDINPKHPAIVYVGDNDGNIFKSTDSGTTWSPASSGLTATRISDLAINAQNPEILYAGTNFGVFGSSDSAASWNPFKSGMFPAFIERLQFDSSYIPMLYANVVTSSAPNDRAVFRKANGASSWEPVGSGAINKIIAIDPQNPLVLYGGTDLEILRSTDQGQAWHSISHGLPTQWETLPALAIDPHNPAVLYAVTRYHGIFKTTNAGESWRAINNGLPLAGLLYIVGDLFIDPQNPSNLFVESRQEIYKSTDGGESWAVCYSGEAWEYVSILAIDPQNTATIFAGTESIGLIKSMDGGATWIPVNNGLTGLSIVSLAIDPQNSVIVYVGTSSGVFLSTNGGRNWYALNKGLVNKSIGPLAIDPKSTRTLYAGIHGSGVWTYITGRSSMELSITPGGSISAATGGTGSLGTGYAEISVDSGITPYGTAVLSSRQNGVVVSEVGIPVSPTTVSARIFIDYRAAVNALPARSDAGTVDMNTGIAVANHGSEAANVTYTLRDAGGNSIAAGNSTVAARHHLACFIDKLQETAAPDFEIPATFQLGSLDVSADKPISVIALRGIVNQREEFLMTTTPVADLTQPVRNGCIYFPQFVDGGGYTTSMILLNTSDSYESGTLQIRDKYGSRLVVNEAGGRAGSSFKYLIPPGGFFRFQTDGSPTEPKAGWVRVVPDLNTSTPVGSGVFAFNPAGVLVSESGVSSANATTHARVYVDLSGDHNTGLAIANIENSPSSITIRAFEKDGVTEAGASQRVLQLTAGGYDAEFADQFIAGLSSGFTGVLDISSALPFAALTLRSLLNERHDFLMTTFPVADANHAAPSPVVFPHIADGEGYATEFILLSPGAESGNTLRLYDDNGRPMAVE
jgi:photosystem II stability/assembly factor-like uncharacterized protein